ncbi:MAG: class I SAM-dependent methyltransferase, partial [Corallincola sp.]|nr:class I SAM-dependent methyltransferase [Corallincola sp.]
FILAAHGARVTLVERHPALAALLADALQRALMDEATAVIASRMQLLHGAALATLNSWQGEPPAVVYLDPMFPHRRKSALVKLEMQWLQQLVGADQDADALLRPARQLARQRVVVKRPDDAPPLAGVKPSGAVASRGHRFDIYAPVS